LGCEVINTLFFLFFHILVFYVIYWAYKADEKDEVVKKPHTKKQTNKNGSS